MKPLFLDTSFAIALSSVRDQHHEHAVALAGRLNVDQRPMVTTTAVLLELGNSLAKLRYRSAAIDLLAALQADPQVQVIPVGEQLYERGFRLFSERADKEWTLTDCISFVVMAERKLDEALTADEHFAQAGFRALLREQAGHSD